MIFREQTDGRSVLVTPDNLVYIIYRRTQNPLGLEHINDKVYIRLEDADRDRELLGLEDLYIMTCELVKGDEP